MPGLADMFQARSLADNQPIGFGDALQQRSNSLVGLGLGLLQPYRPWAGESSTSNALQGYMGGAQVDARTAHAQAQMQHTKRQEAFQRSQAGQAQANWERQFARGDVTDAQRAMKDVLGPDASPQQKAEFMKSYYQPKTEQPSITWQDDPGGSGNKVPFLQDPRAGKVAPIPLPGATTTSGNPYGPAGKMTTDEGKTALFADRAATAHAAITQHENINQEPGGTVGALVQQNLPAGVANALVSGERGSAMDAQRAFVNALLRRESGAAINAGEFTSYAKEYFPQYGDTPKQIEDKRKHRAEVIAGLARESGKGYRPTYTFDESGRITRGAPAYVGKPGGADTGTTGGPAAPRAVRRYNPETGKIE